MGSADVRWNGCGLKGMEFVWRGDFAREKLRYGCESRGRERSCG